LRCLVFQQQQSIQDGQEKKNPRGKAGMHESNVTPLVDGGQASKLFTDKDVSKNALQETRIFK